MTVGVALLLYVACAGAFGPRVLRRTSWTDRAPLLGIVLYLAAVWSVIAAAGLAGLTLAVHATALGGGLSHLIGACVLRLRATYATPGGATVAGLGLTLAGAVAARTAVTAAGHLRATARQAMRHAHTARLAGVPQPALGAVLLEHPQPAAYCVAAAADSGPDHRRTAGAEPRSAPGGPRARAAHLAGHHHRLLALARIGRRALPFLPLTREADVQVARLIELHADDAATRTSDPVPLAAALVVLATAAASPAPALAAAATNTVQRIQRLLHPAAPLSRVRQQLLRATASALARPRCCWPSPQPSWHSR